MKTVTTQHAEWPMPEYLKAWKLFRDNSDENTVTAQHLLGLPSWPRKTRLEICDLGCGDGRLVSEIITHCPAIQKVRLVDPDNGLLCEAGERVERQFSDRQIVSCLNSVKEGWPKCAGRADIILGVHLVYLLEEEELHALVRHRPRKAITYVVLDAPTSVFTELWQWTADKYYRRAKLAHKVLCEHLGLTSVPRNSVIRSRIPQVMFTKHELANWLLSILCYRNMLTDVPIELRHKVREIINKHTNKKTGFVECESVCYELPPMR